MSWNHINKQHEHLKPRKSYNRNTWNNHVAANIASSYTKTSSFYSLRYRSKSPSVSHVYTPGRQTSATDSKPCFTSTRACFGTAPQLAINILIGITFIDLFIPGLFPTNGKLIPWRSSPVEIPTIPEPGCNVKNTQNFHENWNWGREHIDYTCGQTNRFETENTTPPNSHYQCWWS